MSAQNLDHKMMAVRTQVKLVAAVQAAKSLLTDQLLRGAVGTGLDWSLCRLIGVACHFSSNLRVQLGQLKRACASVRLDLKAKVGQLTSHDRDKRASSRTCCTEASNRRQGWVSIDGICYIKWRLTENALERCRVGVL